MHHVFRLFRKLENFPSFQEVRSCSLRIWSRDCQCARSMNIWLERNRFRKVLRRWRLVSTLQFRCAQVQVVQPRCRSFLQACLDQVYPLCCHFKALRHCVQRFFRERSGFQQLEPRPSRIRYGCIERAAWCKLRPTVQLDVKAALAILKKFILKMQRKGARSTM